jgi:hypothetical protein
MIVKITCHIDNGLCKPHNSAGTQDAPAGAPVLRIATAHIVRANKYCIPNYSVIFIYRFAPLFTFNCFESIHEWMYYPPGFPVLPPLHGDATRLVPVKAGLARKCSSATLPSLPFYKPRLGFQKHYNFWSFGFIGSC